MAAAKVAAGTAERTAADGADSVEEPAEHQDIMAGTASASLPRTASIVDPIMATNLSKVSGTSFYNLPLEYLPLLQHKPTVSTATELSLDRILSQIQQAATGLQQSCLSECNSEMSTWPPSTCCYKVLTTCHGIIH
jgi:hypothetical protein